MIEAAQGRSASALPLTSSGRFLKPALFQGHTIAIVCGPGARSPVVVMAATWEGMSEPSWSLSWRLLRWPLGVGA